MKAADVMTSGLITVTPDTSVKKAAQLMLRYDISGFPVIDRAGRLVGIVTEGDFLRRAETGTERHRPRWLEVFVDAGRLAEEYTRSHGRKVEEVMTSRVFTATEDTPLDAVVELMERHHIKRVPVVRNGHLIGMVTRPDLLHTLVVRSPSPVDEPASDAHVRARILAELARQRWAPRRIEVSVRDGVVELRGVLFDERHRSALRVLAENTPGVKEVHDNLSWVEPGTGIVMGPVE
jgi:CBS domain-containing protein